VSYYIHTPLISLVISFLLLIGSYKLGEIIFLNKKLLNEFVKISDIKFQKLVAGHTLSLIILFPLLAFTNQANVILKVFGFILIFLSFLKIINFFKKINIKYIISNINRDNFFYLNLFILILYFLIAASPETSADSLDYHSGSALNILRFNHYVIENYWFTSAQSGSGESLIALGFSMQAEQFGSLIQFSSLLSIFGIIRKISDKHFFFGSKNLLSLIILTCPVLLFLVSGNKPQLFFSSLLFISLAMIYIKNKKQNFLFIYTIINILIFISITGKFSFNLSGFLIWLLATYKMINKRNFVKLLGITICLFFIFLFPLALWKYNELGGNLITYFFSPFPIHLPGYDYFLKHIQLPANLSLGFPYFFFTASSLSTITETLGFSSIIILILFLNLKDARLEIIELIILIILFIIISNLYASPSARYYFDIILWSALGVKFLKNDFNSIFFRILSYFQISIIICALLFASYNFFPGSLTWKNYENVKNKYAFQYSGIDWVNKNTPDGSSVIIFARPISIYKEFAISGIFMNFTNREQSIYYQNEIKRYNPQFYVTFGDAPRFDHLKGCISSLYKKKENVGYHATRNPFKKGSNYNAYIYNFDSSKLPDCNENY